MKRLIGENMKAYGENSHSRWARNRQIAYARLPGCADDSSLHRLDPQNVDHLFMRFYVEGERGKATVRLEMTKVVIMQAKLISG
jgi:TIM21